MRFLDELTTNLVESITETLRKKYFRLVGSNDHFSTNEGKKYEGVSGLVGNVFSMKQRMRILAKGCLIGPLINRLFCGTDYVSRIPQKKLKMYVSYIVMRLRIVHKCPREPSLTTLITYPSTDGLVSDFAVDPNTGNVAVATEKFIQVLNSNSGGRMFHEQPRSSSFSNRVAFGGNEEEDSILAVCSNDQICLYGVPIVSNTQNSMTGESAKLSCIQKMTSSATVNTVQFSPDRRVLVICLSNRIVQVLKKKQSDDGNQVWVCVETLEQTGKITSSAFHQGPEILILAIGLDDNTIKIWEISSDETKPSSCVDTLHGHSSSVKTLSFDQHFGMLASGSDDRAVKVWIPNVNGQFICMLTLEHGSSVSSVAFSPSGFLASGGSTREMCKLWRIFMSATCVNAELVLTKFVNDGIDQLKFCQKTGNLLICMHNGVDILE
jgi:WD40 repeat protein